jgi:hypothetical protein
MNNPVRSMIFLRLHATFVAMAILAMMAFAPPAYPGKHPYPELTHELAKGVRDILIRHGMPVRHDRGNPWLSLAAGADAWIGGAPKYTVYFDQTDEIPRAAQLEVIDFLMTLHASRGRRETIRLEMRRGVRTHTISMPKPDFELTLHKKP